MQRISYLITMNEAYFQSASTHVHIPYSCLSLLLTTDFYVLYQRKGLNVRAKVNCHSSAMYSFYETRIFQSFEGLFHNLKSEIDRPSFVQDIYSISRETDHRRNKIILFPKF
jgi:hypothetical protein